MNLQFSKLTTPTPVIVEAYNRWENDLSLIPFTRPNPSQAELELKRELTNEDLQQRLEYLHIYLIYFDHRLVGEMNYMVDPEHLFIKEPGTAWIGITIGEREARGKGVGHQAMQYLEEQIKQQGLQRIELGVFEFNHQAQKLYLKLGYKEIGRIPDFTYYQNKMWTDIRMEKYITNE